MPLPNTFLINCLIANNRLEIKELNPVVEDILLAFCTAACSKALTNTSCAKFGSVISYSGYNSVTVFTIAAPSSVLII